MLVKADKDVDVLNVHPGLICTQQDPVALFQPNNKETVSLAPFVHQLHAAVKCGERDSSPITLSALSHHHAIVEAHPALASKCNDSFEYSSYNPCGLSQKQLLHSSRVAAGLLGAIIVNSP